MNHASGNSSFSIQKSYRDPVILWLSWPLALLVAFVSYTGLVTPGFYAAETLNWQAQSLGQDMVDLTIMVPALLISSFFAYRQSLPGKLIWAGVVLYLTYTYVIYCFDVHFNQLFLGYCCCLSLSFYSFLYFLLHEEKYVPVQPETKGITRVTGIYFLAIAVLFYLLWLAEIIPSLLERSVPKSVMETGLFTNGVHVIDLSVFLPCIFLTGYFLLKGKRMGFVSAPVLLTFFVLMDITIGSLVWVMKAKGIESDLTLMWVMDLLALFSLILLVSFLKKHAPINTQ